MYKYMECPAPREPMVMKEKKIPDPPPKGMIVKVKYAGVCHSDLHMQDDDVELGEGKTIRKGDVDPDFKFPLVFGHEISGTVQFQGSAENKEADNFEFGDNVVVFTFCGCTDCDFCKSGDNRWCLKSLSCNIGLGTQGGYAEYVSVYNRAYVYKVPDSIPMEVAPMLSCGALTAYNGMENVKESVLKWTQWKGKATVLIIGAGGLGLWCVQLCKAVLPATTRIAVADISAQKLETAKENGADVTIRWNPKDDTDTTTNKTKEVLGGLVESAIDFVGSPSTLRNAVNLSAKGSTVSVVGLFGGAVTIPIPFFPMKMLKIVGIYTGSTQQFRDLIAIVKKHKIPGPKIFKYKLEDLNDIFEKLRKGDIDGRAVIEFN